MVTQGGQVVSSIVSDPTSVTTYTFTAQSTTDQPIVSYSLDMSKQYGATVSSNPFVVTLPAFTPTLPNVGPQSASSNSEYAAYCSTLTAWYLEFSFDMSNFTKVDSNFHLGTTDYYIKWLGKQNKSYLLQLVPNNFGGQIGIVVPTSEVLIRFQFDGVYGLNVIINGITAYSTNNTGYATFQHVVFSHTLQDASSLLSNVPLTISNITLGLPTRSFTPSLRYNSSSSELYPFLLSSQSNVVSFTTPTAQISTGSNAPNIVLDLTFSNDPQSTVSYEVTQVGTIPDVVLASNPPLPSTLIIKELVPFGYLFGTSLYYPPPTSTASYSNLGLTPVTISGTSNAVMSIPAQFEDVNVVGDRNYRLNYLYNNQITLTIELPYFTEAIDSGVIGFGPQLNGTIVADGSGSNTLSFGSNSVSYTESQTLMFVPVSGTLSFQGGIQLYLENSSGSVSAFPGGPITLPYDIPLAFSMNFQSSGGYTGNQVVLTVNAPDMTQVSLAAPTPVALDPFANGTNYLLPYASGNGTSVLNVASTTGFLTIPDSVPILFKVNSVFDGAVIGSLQCQLTIVQGAIDSSPDIYSNAPPSYVYSPFPFYTFTIPKLPNTTLITYNSDSNIRPYLTNLSSNVVTLSAPSGFTSAFSNALLLVEAIGPDGNTSGTLKLYLTASSNIIVSVPAFTGTIDLYKYEPFSYAYSLVPGVSGITLNSTASSTEVRSLTSVVSNILTFGGKYQTSYSRALNFIVNANNSSNISIDSRSNAVYVNPGRFSNPVNTTFAFYQYEDLAVTYGSNIRFDTAAFLDNPPASSPALPTGLSFASVNGSSNYFVLKGTPQLQSPSNQYLILGVNSVTNQTVTTKIAIKVNPPRIQISPSALSLSGLQIGTEIAPQIFTSVQPAALTINEFRYNWDTLPDGFYFTDINGNVVTQPYRPFIQPVPLPPFVQDPTLTIILKGTPTLAAATSLVNAGLASYSARLYATQYQPKGAQTNQTALMTFSFGETVLFDDTTIPKLYATQPLTSSTLIFKARAYFVPNGEEDPIVLITAPSLPNGLSIFNSVTGEPNYVNFNDYTDGVFVSGTPTNVSSNAYSITATTQNGFTQTETLTIPVYPDSVSFTSTSPSSVSLIVSRPLDLDYTLVFTAVSVITGQMITYTTSIDLTLYGLVLSSANAANGSLTITGTPTQPLATTTLVITATDTLGTFATTSFPFTISPDVFTFGPATLNFIQHVPITPISFSATASSGRQVISYASSDLPSGLSLSLLGRLSGTPTTNTGGLASNLHITGSTGYPVGGTETFSYTTIADNILTLLTANPLAFSGSTFSFDAFRSFTYSGNTPTLAIDQTSIKDKNGGTTSLPTLNITSSTFLTGSFSGGSQAYSPFSFNVVATYLNTSATLSLQLYWNGTTGTLSSSLSLGSLVFTAPTQLVYVFYQHCPIPPIVFKIGNASDFTYFYTSGLPVGLVFTPDPTGTFATLSGTPAVFNDSIQGLVVYASNGGYTTAITIQIRVITPFFVNPQENGASAYTALLRNQVLVNAATNARDNIVFPEIDAGLGYLQSPGAPDVLSPKIPCTDGTKK